jgi:hypothetical protein
MTRTVIEIYYFAKNLEFLLDYFGERSRSFDRHIDFFFSIKGIILSVRFNISGIYEDRINRLIRIDIYRVIID